MKKPALFLVVFAILVGAAFLPFLDKVYSKIQNKNFDGNYSQLSVKSLKGEYSVYIDDKLETTLKDNEKKEVTQVRPGNRSIKLVRNSDVKDFFYTLTKKIDFLPSTAVEIEWEAGPTLESSSGNIRYFSEIAKSDGAQLFVLAFPNTSNIEIDSKKLSGNLTDIYDTATHAVKVSNGEGYESSLIQVNLANEISKQVLTNLRLIVEVYLYKQPF